MKIFQNISGKFSKKVEKIESVGKFPKLSGKFPECFQFLPLEIFHPQHYCRFKTGRTLKCSTTNVLQRSTSYDLTVILKEGIKFSILKN
jgi:hypothetical protein